MSREIHDEIERLPWPVEFDPFEATDETVARLEREIAGRAAGFRELLGHYEELADRHKVLEGSLERAAGCVESWRRNALAWRRVALLLAFVVAAFCTWVIVDAR